MELALLKNIVLILGLSIIVVYLCYLSRIPSIVGFLFTGVVIGPSVLKLVPMQHEAEILSEIGVILLLFTIGIEFSFERLTRIKKSVLGGGSIQVFLTILVVTIIAHQFQQGWSPSIFFGFLLALSSTAIVLKILQERAEIESPHGQLALGILIFQDIMIVVMIIVTPLLAGGSEDVSNTLLFLLLKGLLVVIGVIVMARYIVPHALFQISRTRNRELFLFSILGVCFMIAWGASEIGLSLGLGAFLAGLIISETEYSHQALAGILPFRDVFTSFFFISIGMLLNLNFFFEHALIVSLVALGIIVIKVLLCMFGLMALKYPMRTILLAGLSIAQIGEFSFILAKVGLEHRIITGEFYQSFLAISILSMAATPFVISASPHIVNLILKLPIPRRVKYGAEPVEIVEEDKLQDHMLIIGYGLVGRNVARAAKIAAIPYVIIEMNPDTVKTEREKGENIFYGDAIHEDVLKFLGVSSARVAVIAISDIIATRHITANLKKLNSNIFILVRTRFLKEVQYLQELGADEIIPEEFETAVEIFARVLRKYLVPQDEIELFVSELRAEGYQMLRSIPKERLSLADLKLHIRDLEISTLRVSPKCSFIGRSLAEIHLRQNYGVTLLAIQRNDHLHANPDSGIQIQKNDILVVMGDPEQLAEFAEQLKGE